MKHALSAGLMLIFSLFGPNSGYAQPMTTSTPATKILAIGTINPGVDPAKVFAILPNEVRDTVDLYLNGKINQWYSQQERRAETLMATYDAIVIGTGQAGPSLAGRLAGAGMSVAVVERKLFGGTCVNTGCIPTKTMVASAYAAHMVRRAAGFGVDAGGPVTVDMKRVKARKDEISGQSRDGVEHWL